MGLPPLVRPLSIYQMVLHLADDAAYSQKTTTYTAQELSKPKPQKVSNMMRTMALILSNQQVSTWTELDRGWQHRQDIYRPYSVKTQTKNPKIRLVPPQKVN